MENVEKVLERPVKSRMEVLQQHLLKPVQVLGLHVQKKF